MLETSAYKYIDQKFSFFIKAVNPTFEISWRGPIVNDFTKHVDLIKKHVQVNFNL